MTSQDYETREVERFDAEGNVSKLVWDEKRREESEDGTFELVDNSIQFLNDKLAALQHQFGFASKSGCGAMLQAILEKSYNIPTLSDKADPAAEEDLSKILSKFSEYVESRWESEGMSEKTFSSNSYDNRTSFNALGEGNGASDTEHMEIWLEKHRVATAFLITCATDFLVSLSESGMVTGQTLPDESAIRESMESRLRNLSSTNAGHVRLLMEIRRQSEEAGRSCQPACKALARVATAHHSVAFKPYRVELEGEDENEGDGPVGDDRGGECAEVASL